MSESQLSEFLAGAGHKPYRELIAYHIGKQSARELQAGSVGTVLLLPQHLQPLGTSYIDTINERFAYNKRFWQSATCKEAFAAVIRLAIEHFPLNGVIESVDGALRPQNHELSFNLFQIATLSFAYSASLERKQREFMGIGGGLSVLREMLIMGIVGLVLVGVYFLLGDTAAKYLGTALFLGLLALVVWRFLGVRKEPRR